MKARTTVQDLGHWLLSSIGHFLLWTVWLGLALLLVVQVVILSSHELRVPTRVIQAFQDRLAIAGLRITFDSASFDPAGHVLIDDVKVFSESFDEPLLTAASIYTKIDPWALIVGSISVDAISVHQLNLFVPSMLSPSGRSEPILSDVEGEIEPSKSGGFEVRRLLAHSGPLNLSCYGGVDRIRTGLTTSKNVASLGKQLLQTYLKAARQVALFQDKVSAFENPTLQIWLKPDLRTAADARLTFLAASADLGAGALKTLPPDEHIRMRDLRIATELPLLLPPRIAARIWVSADQIERDDGSLVTGLYATVSGVLRIQPFQFSSVQVDANTSLAKALSTPLRGLNAHAEFSHWPEVALQSSLRVEDENWGVTAEGNPLTRAFHVAAIGHVSEALLHLAGEKLKRDLRDVLTVSTPPPIRLEATFEAGAKLRRATARFDARDVVAHDVAISRASAEILYDGTSVVANDVLLVQPGNHAFGTYWMDTKTLDYRFLLTGALHPEGINGWFHEWWPHFWSRFDFSAAAPVADVDVQGRWREPDRSNVFIHVEASHPLVRSVPFDLVRTTLFIRPDFYDAVELYAAHGEGEARGYFTRAVDLEEHDFIWMNFAVDTNFNLQEGARLFGSEGTELVEPFVFARPPRLKLSGHLEGEDSPRGKHEDIKISVDSTGDFRFFDFPLSDLRCEAEVQDHAITLKSLQVGFAGGIASGHAQVTGIEPDRHLKLETDLRGANLGLAINILDQYGAGVKGSKVKAPSRFQERLATGKLDLQATAEGKYHDLLSFSGTGHADLHGADLGHINLLGALSAALKDNTVLGFTSWNLDTARASFTLAHDQLLIPDLRLTGPTAKIDAHGTYSLAKKTIEMNAKFYPFEEGKTLLANAVGFVLTPVSAALELKLSGSLEKPKWFFEYGPTNFFRKLAAPEKNAATTAPEKTPPDQPPLFLRR